MFTIVQTSISDTPKASTAMLSYPPPNRKSLASFDQVTRLPSKMRVLCSTILARGDRTFLYHKLPVTDTCLHAKNHNDPCPATWSKAASPCVGFSAVAILGGGWLLSPASDGPPWLGELRSWKTVVIFHPACLQRTFRGTFCFNFCDV